MILVFHRKELPTFGTTLNEPPVVQHLVAIINHDSLDFAFANTQNLDYSWSDQSYCDPRVIASPVCPQLRSSSVGDVFLIAPAGTPLAEGRLMLCAPVGWQEITHSEAGLLMPFVTERAGENDLTLVFPLSGTSEVSISLTRANLMGRMGAFWAQLAKHIMDAKEKVNA